MLEMLNVKPNLRPLKKGVAHFALQAGVPICPVATSGLDRLRPWGRVSISIAPPVRPDPPGWWGINRRVVEVVERVRRAITQAFELEEGEHRRGRLSRAWLRARGLLRRRRPAPAGPEARQDEGDAGDSTSLRGR